MTRPSILYLPVSTCTGDKSGDGDAGEFPVWTDEMQQRRRSVLTEGRWMDKMGSTVRMQIPNDTMTS